MRFILSGAAQAAQSKDLDDSDRFFASLRMTGSVVAPSAGTQWPVTGGRKNQIWFLASSIGRYTVAGAAHGRPCMVRGIVYQKLSQLSQSEPTLSALGLNSCTFTVIVEA